MMLYKVIEYFGPGHPGWKDFAEGHWIQPFTSFDSVDRILCPDLFTPKTAVDWDHCVKEDSRLNLIIDQEYARRIAQQFPQARFVGLMENSNCDGLPNLSGYDLLDQYNDVSLITNWGPHDKNHPLAGFSVGQNGLFATFETVRQAADFLQSHFPDADHKAGSIWAIFNAGA